VVLVASIFFSFLFCPCCICFYVFAFYNHTIMFIDKYSTYIYMYCCIAVISISWFCYCKGIYICKVFIFAICVVSMKQGSNLRVSVFSEVRVTRSLALYVCFVDRCLSFCIFTFGHCVVCSSSIYGFRLPLWYFQTVLWNRSMYNHGLVLYTLLPGFLQSWIGTLYSFTWFCTIMDWYFLLFYLVIVRNQVKEYKVPIHDCTKPGKRV
jgi:hypothetical protein